MVLWQQVTEHHICLIIEKSHIIISPKSNGTTHEERDKPASRFMPKNLRDRHSKYRTVPEEQNGWSPYYKTVLSAAAQPRKASKSRRSRYLPAVNHLLNTPSSMQPNTCAVIDVVESSWNQTHKYVKTDFSNFDESSANCN
jgi:hypothetical protein